MSKLFCLSPGLRVLERQMQQPPGYRPRGYGICIIEEMDWKSRGNYSEIVDCVISRMQLEHLKKRVEEIFAEADKELIFRSMKHRNDFYSLLMGKRAKALQHTPNYAAAVFLLSADEKLWDRVCKNVLDTGIYFDRRTRKEGSWKSWSVKSHPMERDILIPCSVMRLRKTGWKEINSSSMEPIKRCAVFQRA